METPFPKARVALLLSGGIDSIALAAWKKPDACLTIDYGQLPAQAEIKAAKSVCRELEIEHLVLRANCGEAGGGDLAGKPPAKVAPAPEWWPFRNQLLVTLAAMYLLPHGIQHLLFGAVRTDEFHRDGRSDFFENIHRLIHMQEGGMTVTAPAIHMTTAELTRISEIDLRLLAYAHSCHTGNLACGRCRGCVKHREVMEALGLDVY